MIATQSNSNVNDKEDAPCKSGVDNCGAERGKQGSAGQGHPPAFTERQPPPHCVGRAGRRDRGCGVRAQGLTPREGCPRGGLVGDRVRRQRPCSNPKVPKGLKAGALIFRGTREKLNEALGFSWGACPIAWTH